MRIPEVRELSFNFSFSLLLAYPTFFYASFRRVGRFRFSGVKRYVKCPLNPRYQGGIFILDKRGEGLF
ncbi:hypothetical protein D2S45_12360 [Prevotella intermedia]|uniref:Uncharacterized protein n=1 Tax=Prevotella intermedia TaxID=28131 RepID=A0A3R8G5M6_PREIN|nr:hypothetical protein D2S53_12375 [Prevotella intermedia]RRF86263.1 hypothetical protein D2S45_12360 [Prevotella intermedia]